ncbi:hypothetical protein ACHAPJ_010816 [Fusarium lateritium]
MGDTVQKLDNDTNAQHPFERTTTQHSPRHQEGPDPNPIEAESDRDDNRSDDDSAHGEYVASSTASLFSSILAYRSAHGRTFHSEKHDTRYFAPNDEQQKESMGLSHHYLTLLLDDQLYLSPLPKKINRVLDVGTGTGIWAIDFADEFPDVEVIGTDLSPIQPNWVPPNVKFEIDDATKEWTWPGNYVDFIHMRHLIGAIPDWNELMNQAFRCCTPGGYLEWGEINPTICSDDGTTDGVSAIQEWNELFRKGSEVAQRGFCEVENDLQLLPAAGFVDVKHVDYKVPIGSWAKDKRLRQVGEFLRETIENDLEGYTTVLWHDILQWPDHQYQLFLMGMRKFFNDKRIHGYVRVRYIHGRKPGLKE